MITDEQVSTVQAGDGGPPVAGGMSSWCETACRTRKSGDVMSRDVRGEDVFDSRDVIERIDELEASIDDDGKSDLDDDEAEELAELREFRDEVEGYCEDWRYGATFIRDSYFETYAEDLADDIGAIDSNASWPLNHIDWKAAADELRQDYSNVDAFGDTYWYR